MASIKCPLDDRSETVCTEDGYVINKCLNGDSSAFGLRVDKYKAALLADGMELWYNTNLTLSD